MSEGNSNIGTKNYWKEVYETELHNFEDHGDEGDIWFGKSNMKRIMDWLCSNEIDKSWPLLDLGCGNGVLLSNLAKVGFQDLTGIDYVEEAISLATRVAEKNGTSSKLEAADFLCEVSSLSPTSCLCRKYNIIIDKGTYDAIGMCPVNGNKKRQRYKNQLSQILKPDGIFIVVSCNWTKEELLAHFNDFQVIAEIPTPTITFGGKTGNTVTSIVFKKPV